jgi:hypothetical protein
MNDDEGQQPLASCQGYTSGRMKAAVYICLLFLYTATAWLSNLVAWADLTLLVTKKQMRLSDTSLRMQWLLLLCSCLKTLALLNV